MKYNFKETEKWLTEVSSLDDLKTDLAERALLVGGLADGENCYTIGSLLDTCSYVLQMLGTIKEEKEPDIIPCLR